MRVLRKGARGADVKRWQVFLVGQGFDPGVADGIFGDKTVAASKAFQKQSGLNADGVVGLGTFGAAMQLGFEAAPIHDDSGEGPEFPPPPNFAPLVGTAARQAVFGKFRFVSAPVADNREAIRILESWDTQNIVRVDVTQLRGVKGAPASGAVFFHRLAADQFRDLWQAWDDAALLDRVSSWAGSFVPRFIRGSKTVLSNHAFGSAFDINAPFNPLGAQPALVGQKGSVRELVKIANDHGFYWGGHFKSRRDGMHFEVASIM